jgi:SAM-dependent methyltransferase
MDTKDRKQVHDHVSKTYGTLIQDQDACCGGGPKGVAAAWAGYGETDTADLPEELVQSSFGCGNPLAFSGVKPGDTVLDLGSGAGLDLLIAAKIVGPEGHVIGVDMTDEMIDAARRYVAEAGVSNVEVRKGQIEALPVEDASVDWVISNCVINLSPDKPAVFREIARVLKPGGQIHVSDIVAEEVPDWLRRHEHVYTSCFGGAVPEAEYLQGLRDAGLVDADVRERLVYDESQLRDVFKSEVDVDQGQSSCCCCGSGTGVSQAFADEAVKALLGKVSSAKIYARKP